MRKNLMIRIFTLILLTVFSLKLSAQDQAIKIALLKYPGGGDWYVNPTSLPNLIAFCNENISTNIDKTPVTVDVGSPDLFKYSFVHLTGHGNIELSDYEVSNLRNYLISGGFLHVDDNYGLDQYVRREIKKLFPEEELIELPVSHPIYHIAFDFPDGIPKIHEHDNKPPQGFAIIYQGRMVLFYSYETDLGDGWEDEGVNNDSYEVRLKALKMGANIIKYVFEN